MALYTYKDSAGNPQTVDSSTDLTQTAGGMKGNFQLAPDQSTATNYYSYTQSPEKYKQGDVILESPNLNYQSPIIQQMAQQNSLKDFTDPSTGKKIGWQVANPYKLPTTTAGTPTSITGTDPMNINNELLQMQRDALAQQQAAAQQQYESDKSTINQQSATQAQNIQDIGGRATGSLRRILGRAGGFTTTAGATALVNQDDKITQQLNQLETAKQNALQAASAALATNNAKISQQAFENLQKINDQIYQRQQDQIANFIKFQQLQMDQESANRSQVKFTQENEDRMASIVAPNMVSVDDLGNITMPTPEEISKMAQDYNIDSNLLIKLINEQSAELGKLQATERKAALEEKKLIKDLNSIDTQVVTGGGRTLLINTQDGSIIKDLGSAYKDTGGSGSGGENIFKIGNDDKAKLLASGLTSEDVNNIVSDINTYGYDAVKENLNANQQSVLSSILTGEDKKDTAQFLNKEYLKSLYPKETLKQSAMDAGYIDDGGFWRKESGDTEAYLTYLDGLVQSYRAAGYTDKEILALMQK